MGLLTYGLTHALTLVRPHKHTDIFSNMCLGGGANYLKIVGTSRVQALFLADGQKEVGTYKKAKNCPPVWLRIPCKFGNPPQMPSGILVTMIARKRRKTILITPVWVLYQRSGHAIPSAQPPIDMGWKFSAAQVCSITFKHVPQLFRIYVVIFIL